MAKHATAVANKVRKGASVGKKEKRKKERTI
jgi:hypothetical protein